MFFKPNQGRAVFHPDGREFNREGEDISSPLSSYWARRVADGDIYATKVVTPKVIKKGVE